MAMVGGWKKNFLRRKQQADQLIGRAEKSEVISDYQQEKEKRAETIRQVCKATRSKLGEYARVSDGEFDRRLKKMPEYALSQSMLESAAALGQETLLGNVFQLSSGTSECIAREHVQMLVNIENDVYKPMQDIENEVKAITADKKHLKDVTLDMDAAKNRYHSAIKQAQSTVAAKLEVMKDEMDETSQKVEQARDAFSTSLYNFAAKEPQHSKLLLHWAEAQRKFHVEALKQIEKLIPELEKAIETDEAGGVYGVSLHEHLRRSNRKIAYVLEVCIPALYQLGLQEEGLFRIAGGANKVKKLKAALDCRHDFVDLTEEFEDGRDIHTIAGALKQYIRELPEPLMSYECYERWMAAAKSTGDQRLRDMWEVLYSLPKENFANLEYLIKFLGKLSQHQEVNKMTPSNLAIVFGPNLLWPPTGGGPTVLTTGIQSAIVETLIVNADWFFPGEVDYQLASSDSPDLISANGSEHLNPVSATPALGSASTMASSQHSMTGSLYGSLTNPQQGGMSVPPTSPNLMSASQYTPSQVSPQASLMTSNMTASYHGGTLSAQQPSPTHKRTPSSPTGSMLSLNADGGSGTLSRKGKKPAPLPPERPVGPAPPPPDKSPGPISATVNNVDSSHDVTSSTPSLDKTADRPPIPERPHVPPPGPPVERPTVPEKPAFHPERPKVPPPERPGSRPPEKPEKPSLPSKPEVVKAEMVKAEVVKAEVVKEVAESKPEPSPKPDIVTSTKPEPAATLDAATKSDGTKPDVVVTKGDVLKTDSGSKSDIGKTDSVKLRDKSEGRPDRPDVPPQPFQRTSSGRPARPGPPPPPPPAERQSSLEPRAPLAQAETEEPAAEELPNSTTELTRL